MSIISKIVVCILFFISVILAFSGVKNLSEATLGVGILALACFLGIITRILQAEIHHKGK